MSPSPHRGSPRSAEFTATFGLTHTPLEEAQRQTVDWWRERSATPAAA